MIQTQIVWIRQITSKVDIVIWSIEDLLVDVHPATSEEESVYFSYLIKARMRDILRHHQSMYRLELICLLQGFSGIQSMQERTEINPKPRWNLDKFEISD